MSDRTEHILTFTCPEKLGIVHSITEVLVQQRQEIIDLKQFGDRNSQRFFLRVHFASAAGRDTERKALANAVKWHCEGRVFLNGNRTVVLK